MSKPKQIGRFFLIIVVIMFFAACSSVKPDPPHISLKSLEIVEMSLSHALMQAELNMVNPNDFDLDIKHVDYELKLNDVRISSGSSSRSVLLPANGRESIRLDLSSSYLALLSFLQKVRPGEPLEYELDGTVDLGGFGFVTIPYPINKTGQINLDGLPR